MVDAKGVVHLIYFKGDAKAGDIFYVRQEPASDTFSPPLRVNSEPASAIAVGTIRGAQLALGRNGRVHVAWNGTKRLPDAGRSLGSGMRQFKDSLTGVGEPDAAIADIKHEDK